MIVDDYSSFFACTILNKIIINFFSDIMLSYKKALDKRIIDKDIFQQLIFSFNNFNFDDTKLFRRWKMFVEN